MKFITHDGELIQGNSHQEIIECMRNDSKFCSHQTLCEFVHGFAERWKVYSGKDVSILSFNGFVNGLVSTGYMS